MNSSRVARIFNFILKGLVLFLVLMLLANPASAAEKAEPQSAAASNVIPLHFLPLRKGHLAVELYSQVPAATRSMSSWDEHVKQEGLSPWKHTRN